MSPSEKPIDRASAESPAEQRPAHQKHPVFRMFLIGTIASIIGVALTLWLDWFPAQGSSQSERIDTLYDVLMIVSIPIFVLVMTIAIYCVVAFRAKPGERGDGANIHGNTRLEIVWVTIPFIIVTALAVYGWIVLDDIEAKQDNELVVQVTGEQFAWTFEYPEEEVTSNELVLPVDRPVFFRINAQDVIHSFWVPEFRMKQDAVPGLETSTRVTPIRIGNYPVVCAELCGIGHATMRQQVRVVEEQEYEQWLAERRGEGGEGADEAEDPDTAGREIFVSQGCNACHTLADADATSEVGPDLNDFAAVAQDRVPNLGAEEYARQAIVDPRDHEVEGYSRDTMPDDYGERLTDEEIDTLVSYLLGQRQTEEGE